MSRALVAGVDGCRSGWCLAVRETGSPTVEILLEPNFSGVLERCRLAAMIIVDMPIGLAETGRRACERLARERLGRRSSSVFATPRRPMLAFADYASANAWGKADGAGLSKQAWNILPKIRELDAAIGPADQARLGEGHPELAFCRLGRFVPCTHSKRTASGAEERRALLEQAGIASPERVATEAVARFGRGVGGDDVYDACALALTGEARLDGRALRLTDDARDARGLVMEIWG